MSSAMFELPSGLRIVMEPDRRAIRLVPSIGGAQVEIVLKYSRADELKTALPSSAVTADLLVSPSHLLGQLAVCSLGAKNLIAGASGQCRLLGYLSDHQLRVVEEKRAGGDLWITLKLVLTTISNEPVALANYWQEFTFDLGAGEWQKELDRVDAVTYVEVLVPIGSPSEQSTAVRRVRNAREMIRENRHEEALGDVRKAIEHVRATRRTAQTKKDAPETPKDRNKEERWAFLIEAAFALLSGALHDDPGVTENFEWSRAEATTLNALTAGLLGQNVLAP